MAPSVLLVDNDSDSITIYSLILKHYGFEVLSARDTTTGFCLAVDRRPDVVVSDLFLPTDDGRSLPERLREDSRTAGTPLIILDSIPIYGNRLFKVLGPSAWLTKPCEPSRLVLEVERLLELEASLPEM